MLMLMTVPLFQTNLHHAARSRNGSPYGTTHRDVAIIDFNHTLYI